LIRAVKNKDVAPGINGNPRALAEIHPGRKFENIPRGHISKRRRSAIGCGLAGRFVRHYASPFRTPVGVAGEAYALLSYSVYSLNS
jgi:hypothetical protein